MIKRQLDGHGTVLSRQAMSCDLVVAAAVLAANLQAFDTNASTPVSNDVRQKVREWKIA